MTDENKGVGSEEKTQKIQSLRDTIVSAEKTIQSAKAILLQLEGKKKTGRRKKVDAGEDGNVVYGTFDGHLMVGNDGKQYPVPANYASKSKLVEGDMMKLIISSDGSFIYKQIGPAERKNLIGIASQDENGNHYVVADGKPYKILLASITYFDVDPGDEVAIVVPLDISSDWAAVENVVQKAKEADPETVLNDVISEPEEIIVKESAENSDAMKDSDELADEWTSDIEDIKKEIEEEEKIKAKINE